MPKVKIADKNSILRELGYTNDTFYNAIREDTLLQLYNCFHAVLIKKVITIFLEESRRKNLLATRKATQVKMEIARKRRELDV